MKKRELDLLVLSDIHLGTYGCHAKELLQYLSSIQPKVIVLNGDIIDIWQFSKRYWPASHMMVVQHFIDLAAQGVPIYYIAGNHDEMLRRFNGFKLGSLQVCNKLSLKLNGEKVWIFHGDVFDVVMQHSKWLAKLGAHGYDILILINRMANAISRKLGKGNISLSKRIKDRVKGAVAFINKFEATVCEIASSNDYHYVICGHIHEPCLKTMITGTGPVCYLNSGDWVENLTALEYNHTTWKLYRYQEDERAQAINLNDPLQKKRSGRHFFDMMMAEMMAQQSHTTP